MQPGRIWTHIFELKLFLFEFYKLVVAIVLFLLWLISLEKLINFATLKGSLPEQFGVVRARSAKREQKRIRKRSRHSHVFRFVFCHAKLPHYRISYREGLGTSSCIMGLTTQDSHILKEPTELYKILKFRVNWANIEQDTAIQKLQNLLRNVWMSGQVSSNPYIC